eukprot:594069-Prymnesium_polylepis.1
MMGEGVDGAWFQSSAVASATATSGDGCRLLQAPNGRASNVATGGAPAGVAPGGAARDEANTTAGMAPPQPCAAAATAVAAAAVTPGEAAMEHEQDEQS